jgi:diphthamide synthase (EF-2-diphthine--ammonia ligase)
MATTINSLSGGKTSSYLAVHYPADIEVFAVVCIDDHNLVS